MGVTLQNWGLDLGDQREKSSLGSLPGFLASRACGLAGGICWSWGWDNGMIKGSRLE